MKKLKLTLATIAFILTALVFVQSCKKSSNADLSGTYELKVNETKAMPVGGNSTAITVLSINDSRCPINANCVSAGEVIVKAKIKDIKSEQTIELCAGGDCPKINIKPVIELNGVKYNYTLKEVTPFPEFPSYPVPQNLILEKTASIIFTKA